MYRSSVRERPSPVRDIASVATFIVALGSCGQSGGPVAPGHDDGAGRVTSTGGRVTLGTEAGVTVPPGAVPAPVDIAIERVATPGDLTSVGAVGQAYRFTPAGLQFLLPVEVFIFVPDAALGGLDRGAVALYASGGQSGSLAPVAAQRLQSIRQESAAGGVTVRGLTTHFSVVSATAEALPFADAGPDRTVTIGERVELVGVGSDPAGGSVSLQWTIRSRPGGSSGVLSETGPTASFTPDIAGDYVLRLTVTKSSGGTTQDETTITAIAATTGSAPTADAGADLDGDVGVPVTLDGSGSSGTPPLTFQWRFLSFPGGSPPALTGVGTSTASFTPLEGGRYTIELTVTDSRGSGTDTVTIVVNAPPLAQIVAPDGVVAGGTVAVVDASVDPEGDPLTRSWSLAAPTGSAATLAIGGPGASFVTDERGIYTVELTVDDGRLSATTRSSIAAVPDVSGTYTSTFTLNAAPACGIEEPSVHGPGDLAVTQQGVRITLHIAAISDGRASDATGPIRPDGSFDFTAPMRFSNEEGDTFSANPRWTGAFASDGGLQAQFSVSAIFCQITGTLEGTKQ